MSYRTTHLGVDFTLFRHEAGGPVHIEINPAFVQEPFKQTEIGVVYVNGKQMTSFEPHEKGDYDALARLRETLQVDSCIPYTIYAFAEVRIRRYESELARCKAALSLAQDSLNEITIDPSQFDFGPAFGGAQQRQADAIKAIKAVLKEMG